MYVLSSNAHVQYKRNMRERERKKEKKEERKNTLCFSLGQKSMKL